MQALEVLSIAHNGHEDDLSMLDSLQQLSVRCNAVHGQSSVYKQLCAASLSHALCLCAAGRTGRCGIAHLQQLTALQIRPCTDGNPPSEHICLALLLDSLPQLQHLVFDGLCQNHDEADLVANALAAHAVLRQLSVHACIPLQPCGAAPSHLSTLSLAAVDLRAMLCSAAFDNAHYEPSSSQVCCAQLARLVHCHTLKLHLVDAGLAMQLQVVEQLWSA